MSSTQNLLAGLNLADLTSLLQARMAIPPPASATQTQARAGTTPTQPSLGGQAIPQFLLAAATKATAPPLAPVPAPSVASAAARRPAPDPPGSRVTAEGSAAAAAAAVAAATASLTASNLSSAVAAVAAAALSRKRSASLLTTEQTAATPITNSSPPAAKKPRPQRSWDEMFGALVSYKARNNSTAVPVDYPKDPDLGLWVKEQKRRKLLLSTEERYKLDLIAFEWDDSHLSRASAATASTTTTTANPPVAAAAAAATSLASLALQLPATSSTTTTTPTVAASATTPTTKPTRNIFDALAEYKQRLHATAAPSPAAALSQLQASINAIAKPEAPSEAQQHWNRMFLKLQAHKTLHGHCDVLLTNPGDPALGLWVLKQREKYQQGTIPKDHKTLLDALGFESDGLIGAAATTAAAAVVATAPPASKIAPPVARAGDPDPGDGDDKKVPEIKERKRVRTFDENFNALLEYKKVHGNVDVPQKYEKDRKLGIWVKNVRQHPQRHSEEQRARLDSIGFKWRKLQLDEQWNDAFKQLLDYKERYGDCNVPSRWKKSPALARWVHTQRTMYRRNKLLDDRKEKLEDAGFVWDCNAMRDDEAFHENYEKLLAFKKQKGHCNIPNKYRRDRPLGRWAAKMRELYSFDQLDADRKKALSDIGFVWKPPIVSASEADATSDKDDNASGEAASQGSCDDESVDYV